jgi:hypothetical protein
MPYRRTGRPIGRPPGALKQIGEHERRADELKASAREHQAAADRLIVKALSSRTQRQLADQLDVSVGFIKNAVRRHRCREVRS